ncbi:MAG TPA: NAD(+)/NADH kinase [Symbiobacteriaceae bacterium]|nr:NAD(+)/NADH kinase [Symbiobacteriaceae bacterium]
MRKIALVVNTEKPLALDATRKLIPWLEARNYAIMLPPRGADLVGRPDLGVPQGDPWATAELLIVLGGDGTLIRAAQAMASLQIPVLGVNTGHLGFLTELENSELFDELDSILAGNYRIEQRLMLSVAVIREGQVVFTTTALNDAVVSKGPRARLAQLGVSVGETVVARYPADGVIISTPTGSTAYSLSAGGPVVGPTVDVLMITPICPHTMAARSIVVAGQEQVTVTVLESPGEVGLSTDGSEPIRLLPGDLVAVSRAPFSARLVRRHSYSFYDVLRRKLANPGR